MPFSKGTSGNPSGRANGSLNKNTVAFKELIMKAYQALEDNPKYGIVKWAEKNQTDFYKIASKLLPLQIRADIVTHKQIIFTPIEGHTGSNGNGPLPKDSGLNGKDSTQ